MFSNCFFRVVWWAVWSDRIVFSSLRIGAVRVGGGKTGKSRRRLTRADYYFPSLAAAEIVKNAFARAHQQNAENHSLSSSFPASMGVRVRCESLGKENDHKVPQVLNAESKVVTLPKSSDRFRKPKS